MGLARLLDNGFATRAVDFLADFFRTAQGEVSFEIFEMFVSGVLQNAAALDHALVVWLLAGDDVLAFGLASELHQLNASEHARTIDIAAFGYSPERRLSLCLRAVSFLFILPVVAASLLISVRRSAAGELAKAAEDLLFDPMLTSYGGDLQAYLGTIPKSDPAYAGVRRAMRRKKKYLDGLRGAGFIKELAPPERHVQAAFDRRQDAMRRAREASEQRSPLLSSISRAIVLYGRSTVSYHYDVGGVRTLAETHLHSFSTTYEEARALHLDPFGLEQRMHFYRTQPIAP
jgi:hypothetical protein